LGWWSSKSSSKVRSLKEATDPSYGALKSFRQRFAQWLQSTQIDATTQVEFEQISVELENPLLQQMAFEHLAHQLLKLTYASQAEQCRKLERLIYLIAYLSPSNPARLIGIERRWTPLALIHLYGAYVHDRTHNPEMLPCNGVLSEASRITLRDLIRRYSNNSAGIISVFGGGGGYGSGRHRYYSHAQSFMAPVWPEMLSPTQAPSWERRRWNEIYGKGEKVYYDLIKVRFDTYILKKSPQKEPLASWASWSEDSPVMSEISTQAIYPLWSQRVASDSKSP
jgi:hypothetical protein